MLEWCTLYALFCVLGCSAGGVLSPIPLYVNDLLKELADLGVGCYWDNLFVGPLTYADDPGSLGLPWLSIGVVDLHSAAIAVSNSTQTRLNASNVIDVVQMICVDLRCVVKSCVL